jgi:hypothetical protein
MQFEICITLLVILVLYVKINIYLFLLKITNFIATNVLVPVSRVFGKILIISAKIAAIIYTILYITNIIVQIFRY